MDTQPFRVFVATWNVGGKVPHSGLDLSNFLPSDDQSDVYVFGFQEIVPLNAGNVIVKDNEPAAKWLSLINRLLNKSLNLDSSSCPPTPAYSSTHSSPSSHTMRMASSIKEEPLSLRRSSSMKVVSRYFKTGQGKQLKSCNCPSESAVRQYRPGLCFQCPRPANDSSDEEFEGSNYFAVYDMETPISPAATKPRFSLVACKQMVGIFVCIWVRSEFVQHVGHLRISCVGRGILGCLGNKGCISVSMSLYQTSFCFVCSHLASGEKEGDQLRRNTDVAEILKNTRFPRICRKNVRKFPERILEHDRVIWFGDLNYRIALSYSKTKILLQKNDWNSLLEKDQLKMERVAGRVFKGWNEGMIFFAPTYKYLSNSDSYAGEGLATKNKRTPAWCDRILWRGDGIAQVSYFRGESRLSDHRPVIAIFVVEAQMPKSSFSCPNVKVVAEELLSSRPCSYPSRITRPKSFITQFLLYESRAKPTQTFLISAPYTNKKGVATRGRVRACNGKL